MRLIGLQPITTRPAVKRKKTAVRTVTIKNNRIHTEAVAGAASSLSSATIIGKTLDVRLQ